MIKKLTESGSLTGTAKEQERKVLEAMRDRSVERLKELFPKQPSIPKAGEDRRNFFLNESGLSLDPFNPSIP